MQVSLCYDPAELGTATTGSTVPEMSISVKTINLQVGDAGWAIGVGVQPTSLDGERPQDN